MWLARKNSAKREDSGESARTVSAVSGEEFAVGEHEYRKLPSCAPYGIFSKPTQGEQLLVLSSQSGQVAMGVVNEEENDLLPGEILLKSVGGASIKLCQDGRVLINGKAIE